MKVQEKYSHILMLPKEREIHKRSFLLSPSTFHTPAQSWSTCMICYLHRSIVWFCNICDTSACFHFHLPWAPHKLSLDVGWKEAMPWWGYIHNEQHERFYGEVKLWLVFAKIFSKSQSCGRKVEETEVSTVPFFNCLNIMVDTSKFTGKGKV